MEKASAANDWVLAFSSPNPRVTARDAANLRLAPSEALQLHFGRQELHVEPWVLALGIFRFSSFKTSLLPLTNDLGRSSDHQSPPSASFFSPFTLGRNPRGSHSSRNSLWGNRSSRSYNDRHINQKPKAISQFERNRANSNSNNPFNIMVLVRPRLAHSVKLATRHTRSRPFSSSPPLSGDTASTPPSIASLLDRGPADANNVYVNGFIRSARSQKRRSFVAIGDGSTLEPLQALLSPEQAQRCGHYTN